MTETFKLYDFLDNFLGKVYNKTKPGLFTEYLEFTVLNEHIKIGVRSDLEMSAVSLDNESGTMSIQALNELHDIVQSYFSSRGNVYENYFM